MPENQPEKDPYAIQRIPRHNDGVPRLYTQEQLDQAVARAVQAERDVCMNIAARVAGEMMVLDGIGGRTEVACRIEHEIRARSTTPPMAHG